MTSSKRSNDIIVGLTKPAQKKPALKAQQAKGQHEQKLSFCSMEAENTQQYAKIKKHNKTQ